LRKGQGGRSELKRKGNQRPFPERERLLNLRRRDQHQQTEEGRELDTLSSGEKKEARAE